jgi:hypothetical protein
MDLNRIQIHLKFWIRIRPQHWFTFSVSASEQRPVLYICAIKPIPVCTEQQQHHGI